MGGALVFVVLLGGLHLLVGAGALDAATECIGREGCECTCVPHVHSRSVRTELCRVRQSGLWGLLLQGKRYIDDRGGLLPLN